MFRGYQLLFFSDEIPKSHNCGRGAPDLCLGTFQPGPELPKIPFVHLPRRGDSVCQFWTLPLIGPRVHFLEIAHLAPNL